MGPSKLIGRLVLEFRFKVRGLKWVHEDEIKLSIESSSI